MKRRFASAMVIARRDYVATVWSRSFVLFLLGPLIVGLFGGGLGFVGSRADESALRPVVAVVADAKAAATLMAAYTRLDDRVNGLPELRRVDPSGSIDAQTQALLGAKVRSAAAVLVDWPRAPRLVGPERGIERVASDVELIAGEVAVADTLARARLTPPTVTIARTSLDTAGGSTSGARHLVARAAQTVLFMLTLLLAGMLLSNLVEEKSNKVIEVLAAAVPIDAIFLGKLIAMLGVSLTFIAIWGTIVTTALLAALPADVPVPVPAVGWPVFVVLGIAYYITNYMTLGGLFLGIGAQAASVREVQTLSMPVTMSQLGIFGLASAVVGDLGSRLGIFAAIFPLSSPITMIARAAQDEAIWPHLAALAWQTLWVALIIRFASRRFRTGVLKSGAPAKGWFKRASA